MSSVLKIPLSFHVTSGYWLVFAAATAEVLPFALRQGGGMTTRHKVLPSSLAATAGPNLLILVA